MVYALVFIWWSSFSRAELALNCVEETTAEEAMQALVEWSGEQAGGVEVKTVGLAETRARRALNRGLETLVRPGDCIVVLEDPKVIQVVRGNARRFCAVLEGKLFGRNCP